MRDERSEDDTDMSERDALKKSRRVKWALAVAGVCVVSVAVVMMARPQPPEKLYAKAMALREAQGTGGGGEMLNILRLLSEAAAAGHTDAQYQLYRLSKILSERTGLTLFHHGGDVSGLQHGVQGQANGYDGEGDEGGSALGGVGTGDGFLNAREDES